MPRLAELLAAAFGSPPDSSLLDARVMAWKYWEPRVDWTEPRSYVIERGGKLLAHVGLWPAQFGTSGPRGIQMIDWAASRSSPGSGVSLVQHMARMYDFIYSIGGSETTRKILPAFGFREAAQTWMAARPIRPLRQALTHQSRNWKLPLRLARNWWWARQPALGGACQWLAKEVAPTELEQVATSQFIPRSTGFYQYLLRCPVARIGLYSLAHNLRQVGHFVLALVRGQARLAGVWLREPSEAAWASAFVAAQRTARNLDGACEFAVKGSDGASRRAARNAGLREAGSSPVYLLDKKGLFPKVEDFQFQLIDDDGAFLDIGRSDYLT